MAFDAGLAEAAEIVTAKHKVLDTLNAEAAEPMLAVLNEIRAHIGQSGEKSSGNS